MIAVHCRSKSVIQLCSALAVLASTEAVLLSSLLLQCSKKTQPANKMLFEVKLNDLIILLRQSTTCAA